MSYRQKHLQFLRQPFSIIYNHEPEWIPRDQNRITDYLSRILDFDDWGISSQTFQLIDARWGPPVQFTVDRFANSSNVKLLQFNSRYMDIGSEAIDGFTVNWQIENN